MIPAATSVTRLKALKTSRCRYGFLILTELLTESAPVGRWAPESSSDFLAESTRKAARCLESSPFEPIANPSHGDDPFGVGRVIFDFLAHPAHMHVQCMRIAIEIGPPDAR